jgi:hypothetical protein
MAKESIKARERKREAMVAKYATKRAALKAAGDYIGLDKLPKNASPVQRAGISGQDSGCNQVKLVVPVVITQTNSVYVILRTFCKADICK